MRGTEAVRAAERHGDLLERGVRAAGATGAAAKEAARMMNRRGFISKLLGGAAGAATVVTPAVVKPADYLMEYGGCRLAWSGWMTPANQGLLMGAWYAYRGDMGIAVSTLGKVSLMRSVFDPIDTSLTPGTPVLTVAATEIEREVVKCLTYKRLLVVLDEGALPKSLTL